MTNAKSGLDAGLFLDEDDDYVVFESGSNKGMCFVSLGGTVVAFLVQCTAQRFTPESHAAVIMSLESPFGYLIAVALGLDPWSPRAALGGLLILGGVLLTESETFLRGEEP